MSAPYSSALSLPVWAVFLNILPWRAAGVFSAGSLSLFEEIYMNSDTGKNNSGSLIRIEEEIAESSSFCRSDSELSVQLSRLVEALGGRAGVLVLWNESDSGLLHTCSLGLSGYSDQKISSIAADAAKKLKRMVSNGFDQTVIPRTGKLQHSLEYEAQRLKMGRLYALVMPVIVHEEITGLFVMLHSQDLPGFLRRYPQMYSLVLDHLEVAVRHANLISGLIRERSWFETIVNRSNDGVAIVDRENRIVGINPAMEKLSGWTVSEAVDQPVSKIFPITSAPGRPSSVPNKGGSSLTLYNQPGSTALPISADPMEAILTDRDGQKLDVEVIGLTVRDSAGLPSGWVMTVRDISKRKETERLGRIFLSAMSHELQTPIAVIKGFAGLMSDPDIDMDRDTIREKAKVILDESERLQTMVRHMLEAASIQAGGISLNCDLVDIPGIIERTIRRLTPMAEAKNIRLEGQIEDELCAVWGDLPRLEQVMVNLVENAVKYSTEGTVVVAAKKHASTVIVSVMDEGPGVSDDEAKVIFRLFERGQETKKKIRGSGLGLFISKAIVEAHGGTIGVERGPNGGACFYFTLPGKEN